MKFSEKVNGFLPLVAGLGFLGGLVRLLQNLLARDDRGLLVRGHFLTWAVMLVLAGTVVLVALAVWKRDGSKEYGCNFTPSSWATLGCLAAMAGCLVTVLTTTADDTAGMVWKTLGMIAVGLLPIWGWFRCRGQKVPTLCPLGVCLFFLSHLVVNYRSWSADPQVMDYLFDLLAAISLMLFCYYTAAFSAGIGSRRMLLATGMLSVALSLMALSVSQWPWLYLGGCCLAATNLCRWTPLEKEEPHEHS